MNTAYLLSGIAIMAAITFATRVFPFVVFRKHLPGERFMRLQRLLPPLVMSILLVYSLKDTPLEEAFPLLRALLALALTVGLHIWKKNALLSIFAGTGLYILLGRL